MDDAQRMYYYAHHESCCVWARKTPATEIGDGLEVEIDYETYNRLLQEGYGNGGIEG